MRSRKIPNPKSQIPKQYRSRRCGICRKRRDLQIQKIDAVGDIVRDED
ncbi:MAG: hypothetical protein IPK58_01110 [Acidobacteria bacterium]|nr:hypothetical protein [Acidobacteriota bacterium]